MEALGLVVTEIVFSGIGWGCLYVLYRNRTKMEEIKNNKYGGKYSAAGIVIILNLVAGFGAVSMFGVMIFFLISWMIK